MIIDWMGEFVEAKEMELNKHLKRSFVKANVKTGTTNFVLAMNYTWKQSQIYLIICIDKLEM